MSYGPRQGPGHYPPPSQGYYPQDPGAGYGEPGYRRGGDGADTVVSIIRLIVGLVSGIFLLHVFFVVFHANQGNGFVSLVYVLAKTLVLGLGDVFTPHDAVIGVVLNYALAAVVYLVVGQLVIKAVRRR